MPTSLYRRSLASMAPPSVAAIGSTYAAGLASAANLLGPDPHSRRHRRTPRAVLVAVLVLCVAFAMALVAGPTLAADPWSRGDARTGVTVQRGTGATLDLRSNALRPAGWTSADAAGLPILRGLVRYDEVAAGAINHAL